MPGQSIVVFLDTCKAQWDPLGFPRPVHLQVQGNPALLAVNNGALSTFRTANIPFMANKKQQHVEKDNET